MCNIIKEHKKINLYKLILIKLLLILMFTNIKIIFWKIIWCSKLIKNRQTQMTVKKLINLYLKINDS